jgi:hypothetical protein
MTKLTLDNSGLANEAGTLTIYNYDAQSGELINTVEEYVPQGVGLPANATIIAPPSVKKNHVAVYREGGWQVIADHRGKTVYSITDGTEILISELGDYPANTTPLAPATTWAQWDGDKWVIDTDAQRAADVKSAAGKKSALINEASSVTQAWQTQLLLGIITDADKAALTSWMKYIQAVQAVNINDESEIIWPQKPQ